MEFLGGIQLKGIILTHKHKTEVCLEELTSSGRGEVA
jgi:hypothetical protein